MSLTVKETSNYVPPPAGTHYGRCFGVVDLGTQPSDMYGPKPRIMLMWELPNERVEYEEDGKKKERPQTISKEYGASLGTKADLRKHLDAWRGKPFSKEELEGFHLPNIIGAPCVITIQHKPKAAGGISAKVVAVAAVPKGTIVPDLFHKKVAFDIQDGNESDSFKALPEWVQKKVSNCLEWNGEAPATHDPVEPADDVETDVPF